MRDPCPTVLPLSPPKHWPGSIGQIGRAVQPPSVASNTCSTTVLAVAELPIPELVENQRRAIVMLSVGAPALDREQALELLSQLEAALVECDNAIGTPAGRNQD